MDEHIVSSGNIFQDMGFADAEERLAKAKLTAIINKIIEERGLTQDETTRVLGINQKNLFALKNGRLKGFSIEQLFLFLEALDQHIEIKITQRSRVKPEPAINVAYG